MTIQGKAIIGSIVYATKGKWVIFIFSDMVISAKARVKYSHLQPYLLYAKQNVCENSGDPDQTDLEQKSDLCFPTVL